MSLLLLLAISVQPAALPIKDKSAHVRTLSKASATILRVEKISFLGKPTASINIRQRPIARQRHVKDGVHYIEFF